MKNGLASALAALVIITGVWPSDTLCRPYRPPSRQADTTDGERLHVQKLLIRGLTEVQLGDYVEAIALYEKALERAPQSATILSALADTYATKGEPTSALFYARQARDHGESRPYYFLHLAELQQHVGAPTAALRTYKSLLRRHPGHRAGYEGLAELQAEMERPRAALRTYDELLRRHPSGSADVHRQRLSLYEKIGDRRGAIEALQALVELRPNDDAYRRQLARLYREQGKYESARALLKPLADAHPDNEALQRELEAVAERDSARTGGPPTQEHDRTELPSSATSNLVAKAKSVIQALPPDSARDDSRRFETAETLLTRTLDRSPESVEALTLLSELYENTGRDGEAGALLERALDQNPRSAALWARAAKAYYGAGQYEKSMSIAQEGLLLFPGRYELMVTAGRAAVLSGQANRAVDLLRDARPKAPENADRSRLTAYLGWALEAVGRLGDAAREYEDALEMNPRQTVAASRYAYLLARQNRDLDRAHELASRAVQESHGNQMALHALGWTHFKQGNLREARSLLETALGTDTPTARLLEDYGDVQEALGNDEVAREYWERALKRDSTRGSLREKLGLDANT